MTHILISIEEFIKQLDNAKELESVIILGGLSTKGKHISFTEKDIKAKALLAYPKDILETSKGCFDDMNGGDRAIYKQALLDLLK